MLPLQLLSGEGKGVEVPIVTVVSIIIIHLFRSRRLRRRRFRPHRHSPPPPPRPRTQHPLTPPLRPMLRPPRLRSRYRLPSHCPLGFLVAMIAEMFFRVRFSGSTSFSFIFQSFPRIFCVCIGVFRSSFGSGFCFLSAVSNCVPLFPFSSFPFWTSLDTACDG